LTSGLLTEDRAAASDTGLGCCMRPSAWNSSVAVSKGGWQGSRCEGWGWGYAWWVQWGPAPSCCRWASCCGPVSPAACDLLPRPFLLRHMLLLDSSFLLWPLPHTCSDSGVVGVLQGVPNVIIAVLNDAPLLVHVEPSCWRRSWSCCRPRHVLDWHGPARPHRLTRVNVVHHG
jgi:hypothetical protein